MNRRSARRTVRDRSRLVDGARAVVGLWHGVRALRGSDERVLDGVLAVRQLAQAALVLRAGTPEAHTLSAVVDLAHGASMAPTALLGRRRRRFAAVQVWTALALAVAEIGAVGSGRRRPATASALIAQSRRAVHPCGVASTP